MLSDPLDNFLDALDFAPIGVIDLIKSMAVSLPLTDIDKRRALKDKTGFDVDAALHHLEEERAEEKAPAAAPATGRRVKTETAAPAQTGRRTTTKYNVVSKTETKTE